ncbi:hypothetical protein [Arthrobacter sp.]|uniref:hypothetical protein n=1 Tax=Arthrobacter sp. TaxID=1667 RepID=UPI003A945D7D
MDPQFAQVIAGYAPQPKLQLRREALGPDSFETWIRDTQTGRLDKSEIKVVCGDCNGGWLSNLEEDVAPILKPLMSGESKHMKTAERVLLARWAMKTAFMVEFAAPSTRTVLPAQLGQFRMGAAEIDGVLVIGGRRVSDTGIAAFHTKME